MAKFESKKVGKKEYLFIDGKRVLKGWQKVMGLRSILNGLKQGHTKYTKK